MSLSSPDPQTAKTTQHEHPIFIFCRFSEVHPMNMTKFFQTSSPNVIARATRKAPNGATPERAKFALSAAQLEKLDRLRAARGLSRSEMLRALIDAA
jgi:hypothetical protein